jgi:hypothetical protein
MGEGLEEPSNATTMLDYEADLCGNIEQALKGLQGYGIMALELIQNADDAGAATLIFDSCRDALVVRNDATFSTCGSLVGRCQWEKSGDPQGLRRACNFHAIARMGGRNKIGAPNQIGRFGIGFVSVYQVTDTPVIRSSGTQLTLNPLSGKGTVAQIAGVEGTEFELPWASEASDIRSELHATLTPPDVTERVAAEIANTLRSSLLFLRNLTRVEVREAGQLRLAVDIDRAGEQVTLDFGTAGCDRWLVLSGDATEVVEDRELPSKFEMIETLDRSRTVSVAIPVEAAPIDGRLFAYLPTQHATGLPLHVNADFFPHASRQDIVLKGEGHERYWNEALIATAAGIIGSKIDRLRDALGPTRLWELGSAALKLRSQDAFGEFWTAFLAAAKGSATIWTTAADWHVPEGTYLAPEGMPQTELEAIGGIGIQLVDEALRPHSNALTAAGARELVLLTATSALEHLQGAGIKDVPELRDLWRGLERLIGVSVGRPGSDAVQTRLKAATFLIDVNGEPSSPDELWRLPESVGPQAVRRYLADCPIAHGDIKAVSGIAALLDEMSLDDFTNSLAAEIQTVEDAIRVIGPEPADVRGLYALLTNLATVTANGTAGATLADTPILRTKQGFITPSRGQLPGHFRDPTGYFELVDTSLFPPGMDEFARTTLGVDVLTFHDYIDTHLLTILERSPTREQYQDIVAQIVARKNELDERGTLGRLRERPFIRTRAGSYARPRDCYYWTAPLATILGDDQDSWVDSNWMPPSPVGQQVQDLLEGRLGLPTTVTPRHIVDRLEELASEGTPDEVADRITPVIRHIIDRWPRFDEDDLDTFRELQDLQFLPAVVAGARDHEELYLPGDVFRAGRAPGFASQVAVIDLTPLRQANVTVNALLELLEVPEEPETAMVVAHLRQCMAEGIAPSDLTYAILNERVEKGDDIASISTLGESRFIWDPQLKRFLEAGEVFWLPPPFRNHWWQASSRMGQRSELFKLLGVRDDPAVDDYAALALRIAARTDLTVEDITTHARCVARLCYAVDTSEAGLTKALAALRADSSLLTVDGDAIWPEDAVWLDSDQLAEPFGSALNHCLVAPPDVERSSAARLYSLLGARALSAVARLRLAAEPDRRQAGEDTELLRDRADLILWVAPNAASRSALRLLLRGIEIQHTDTLRIQAEITTFEPAVTSPVSGVPAFLETENGVLHVAGTNARTNWPAAFRTIFAEVERLCPLADTKPLVATATLIMLSDSWDEAERTLHESGFRMPAVEDELQTGDALGDSDDTIDNGFDGEGLEEGYNGLGAEFGQDQEFSAEGDAQAGDAADEDSDDTSDFDDGSTGIDGTGSSGGRGLAEAGAGDEYRSKPGTKRLGEEEKGAVGLSTGADGRASSGMGSVGAGHRGDGSRERRARTSRMLSYVAREGDRGPDDATSTSEDDDIGILVDLTAIAAAVRFEEQRGWTPEEQPHNNPGYDILSHGPDGTRRLIEVKGLESDWTERGVKLSHVQFGMAQQYPEEYWIYVVERARDLGHQRVNAIGNPFQKVDEYWFDNAWRALADEGAGAQALNVRVGAKVRHQLWGTGTIIEVKKGTIGVKVKIDFGYEGVKFVPFNSSLELVP